MNLMKAFKRIEKKMRQRPSKFGHFYGLGFLVIHRLNNLQFFSRYTNLGTANNVVPFIYASPLFFVVNEDCSEAHAFNYVCEVSLTFINSEYSKTSIVCYVRVNS